MHPGVHLNRRIESARQGLESGLDHMMRVAAPNTIDVQVHLRFVDKGKQEVVHQTGIEITDALLARLQFIDQIRAATEVDHNLHQCLVERTGIGSVTPNSVLITERLRKSLAKGQTHVLDGMMLIDFEIPLGLNLEVK